MCVHHSQNSTPYNIPFFGIDIFRAARLPLPSFIKRVAVVLACASELFTDSIDVIYISPNFLTDLLIKTHFRLGPSVLKLGFSETRGSTKQ